jgi:hypothetical protein
MDYEKIIIQESTLASQKESLMKNIKLLCEIIQENEKLKKYEEADLVINELIEIITNFLNIHKELNKETINSLKTLMRSYQEKKNSYNYLNFLNEKSILIKQKMIEKYLGKKDIMTEDLIKNSNNNWTQMSEYELIPSNPAVITIKDIIEICNSLIKFYVLQIDNITEKKVKSINDKSILESFFVFDAINLNNNTPLGFKEEFEQHIESVKYMKTECERIADSNLENDHGEIEKNENQINIIKEEIHKIYPKYLKLKEILYRNNLVKKKATKQ